MDDKIDDHLRPNDEPMIRFDVVGGAAQPDDARTLGLLRETQGDRWIAMAVGTTEWVEIERGLEAQRADRA